MTDFCESLLKNEQINKVTDFSSYNHKIENKILGSKKIKVSSKKTYKNCLISMFLTRKQIFLLKLTKRDKIMSKLFHWIFQAIIHCEITA